MSKQGSCLEKEIVQGTTPAARRRGRPCTAWMDNIKMWTGLPVEESVRMTEDRDRESTSMAWPTLGSRTAEEQNRTGLVVAAAYQPLLSVVLFISRQSSESLSVTSWMRIVTRWTSPLPCKRGHWLGPCLGPDLGP